MTHYRDANRLNWNDRTAVHAKSPFYGVDAFLAGKNTLTELELTELGDVAGRSLLHLQCHFGMDSLSWARLGAHVTGVDFSEKAIELAESLNERLGLDARFLRSDIYDAKEALGGQQFDIVYTSYGVLVWLPDLTRWAELIGASLKPGGTFYMAEMHPLTFMYDVADDRLAISGSYFEREAQRYEDVNSYTGDEDKLAHPVTYQWQHTLSEIVSALAGAGLAIEFLHEFPYAVYNQFPGLMVRDEQGRWRLQDSDRMPLLFSVKAVKR